MPPIMRFILAGLLVALPVAADALTAAEIDLLRQNGVEEATIQRMVASEAAARSGDRPTDMGVRTITRPDGRPAIVYRTGRGDSDRRKAEERRKEERAWEMLRQLIVDTRGK